MRVEETEVGRERRGDVGEGELKVPIGDVSVGIDELILVEVHDRRHVAECRTGQRLELAEIHERRGEHEVPSRLSAVGFLRQEARLFAQCDGGATHAPFPLPSRQGEQSPVRIDPLDETVEDRTMRAAVVGLDRENAQSVAVGHRYACSAGVRRLFGGV